MSEGVGSEETEETYSLDLHTCSVRAHACSSQISLTLSKLNDGETRVIHIRRCKQDSFLLTSASLSLSFFLSS